jgi:hypothetical protein
MYIRASKYLSEFTTQKIYTRGIPSRVLPSLSQSSNLNSGQRTKIAAQCTHFLTCFSLQKKGKYLYFSVIWGCRGGEYEDICLVGCSAV